MPSHIPKPNPNLKSVYHPKKYLPQPSLCPSSHTPKPMHLPKPLQMPSANTSPCVKQLLQHLSTLNSPSPKPNVNPTQLKLPSGTQPVPPTPSTPEKVGMESPCSTSTVIPDVQ